MAHNIKIVFNNKHHKLTNMKNPFIVEKLHGKQHIVRKMTSFSYQNLTTISIKTIKKRNFKES